ncbi:hypothetical protein LZ32DRAFT_434904 [Colletotrichum eremochloae]|nr:hypothetical protein LZ32DRAFT_434904 [Colletotrichum eremochloae]
MANKADDVKFFSHQPRARLLFLECDKLSRLSHLILAQKVANAAMPVNDTGHWWPRSMGAGGLMSLRAGRRGNTRAMDGTASQAKGSPMSRCH